MLRTALLYFFLAISFDAAAAPPTPAFAKQHVLLVEAKSICGAGQYYYVKAGQLGSSELAWLRQLLSYRFNGTVVTDVGKNPIDFEEGTNQKVTDKQIAALTASNDFSTWLGPELVLSLKQLGAARAELLAATQKRPPLPEKFIQEQDFKRYHAAANGFYKALASKYRIIDVDNQVDCD